jgi:hypothetical protein
LWAETDAHGLQVVPSRPFAQDPQNAPLSSDVRAPAAISMLGATQPQPKQTTVPDSMR